jgi:adenylate cyclase
MEKKTLYFPVLFLLIFSMPALCQNNSDKEIKKLKSELKSSLPGQKVNAMFSLCYEYFTISADSALNYATKALEISKELKNDTLIGRSYLNMGHSFMMQGKDSLTYYYLTKSADIFIKLSDSSHLANTLLDLGQYYYFKGDYENSLKYYTITLGIYRKLNKEEYYENAMLVLYDIGSIYYVKKNYTEAMKYLHYALKLADARKDNGSRVSIINMSIGDIYSDWKLYKNALEYYRKAYDINQTLGDKDYIGYSLLYMCNVYFELKSFDTSYYYITKAAELFTEADDMIGLSSANENIGNYYKEKKNYKTALNYYTAALKTSEQKKEKSRISDLCYEISQAYYSMKDYGKALENCNRSLAIADSIQYKQNIYMNHLLLSDIYNSMNNTSKAYFHYKKYATQKDSIFNIDIHKQISDIQEKYETDKKEKEIKILKQTDEIQKINIRRQKILKISMMIVAGLMLVLAIVIFRSFRQKRKANIIIAAEKQKSDNLLLNILPEQTAEELKEKGYASTRYYDMVSVLFTDFAGFTAIAEKLSPENLVAELDYCFKGFDSIIEKYRIEKIKTIGDSYMCAGGLPEPNTTNPADVVKCGLEICSFMNDYKNRKSALNEPYFEIRVGIHTGPVVSGIVGTKKFAYDIWGDTVNTAARMESSGKAGHVNISGNTYRYIKDDFNCIHRGKIEAKNKGMIDMYFVEM